MTKKLQPKLRFRGFTDDWEQRKLKDLHKQPLLIEPIRTATYLSWSVPAFNDGVPEIARGSEIASVKQSVGFGDVLLCRINPRINRVWVVEPVGNANFPMIASTEWVVFANEDGDSHFLSALFSSDRFRNMLLSEVAGVTGSQKRFQVASVLQHEESFPSKLEQKRIGALFSKLDQLIAAEKRTLNLLKDKKTALLQQIFTQKIRFKGFSGFWKCRRLKDEAISVIAGGDIDRDMLLSSGRYPVIGNALTNNGVIGYYEKTYEVIGPAVTVTGRGEVGIAKVREGNFTPVVRLLVVKSVHNPYFLECAINQCRPLLESTGVPQLTVPKLSNYELSFPPTVSEEMSIGSLFNNINSLIAAINHKIELIELKKKSLLEKMFI